MRLLAALALTALLSLPLSAGQMVVFGDSLSDGGYYLPFVGRQTNGDLWHEYLADRLGLERATVGGFLGTRGLNLAVSASLVSDLPAQVNRYDDRHFWLSGDLCTLWIGGNDLRNNPNQDMVALTAQIGDIIAQLAVLGIDHFLVPNLPDLGAIPESPGDAQRTAGTIAFNTALDAELDARAVALGITIERLDIFSLFNEFLTNPGDYGFTNTTDPWKENQGADADAYVFWDDIHPTTRSHSLIAAAAYAALAPDDAPIEIVSWSISPAGTLRETWFADPDAIYQVLSGPSPAQLTPAATFTGKPAYTATVPSPGGPTGFFQIRRN